MRQPGSALRTAATCSFSNAASASPLPFAARIFATTVSTSAIVVVSSAWSDCVTQGESVLPPSCRMRAMPRERSLTPAALAARRAEEQRAAADFMRVKHVVMLGYPDGFLDETREFLGDIVRAIRQYRPHTVFVHDPYRIRNFQHRDHRKAGLTTTDAIYPFARDHLHFPEQITQEGLATHKVRELWYWGADEPNVIVDVTESIDRQIAALVRHESQMPGFNVTAGETIGARLKKGAAALAEGYGFHYGAVFRRLIARR